MDTNTIEREISIRAPIDRVWSLIAEAEHLGAWFGDAGADIDLRPGGPLEVWWADHALSGEVVTVEPTSHFAFWWYQVDLEDGVAPAEGNSTLVDFRLEADGDEVTVRVIESGFDALPFDAERRAGLRAGHVEGWARELADLTAHTPPAGS